MSIQNPITAFPPDIQVALVHFLNFAATHGRKACKQFGVGAFRAGLGPPDPVYPENVIPMRRESEAVKYSRALPKNGEFHNTLDDWRKGLAGVCEECGRCRWAKRVA